jgi:Icc-related predicted phosphoesterase
MRILAVSDLHGDLDSVREAIAQFAPDRLLCCGDWGDPEQVARADLEAIVATLPVLTTFGNHDPLELLPLVSNRDGSPILLGQGEVRTIDGLRVAAIGGIWAKSHRLPHYVTDEDVAGFAKQVAAEGPVDILMNHGCPVGLADRTPKGTRGGQRCFLDAFHAIAPRVHLCGHLHVPQERTLKDGRRVLNVGATPGGSVVVIDADGDRLDARLAGFDRTP